MFYKSLQVTLKFDTMKQEPYSIGGKYSEIWLARTLEGNDEEHVLYEVRSVLRAILPKLAGKRTCSVLRSEETL